MGGRGSGRWVRYDAKKTTVEESLAISERVPAHVAAAWLGHSTIVANKHYWQVTDADFERATKPQKSSEVKAAHKAA